MQVLEGFHWPQNLEAALLRETFCLRVRDGGGVVLPGFPVLSNEPIHAIALLISRHKPRPTGFALSWEIRIHCPYIRFMSHFKLGTIKLKSHRNGFLPPGFVVGSAAVGVLVVGWPVACEGKRILLIIKHADWGYWFGLLLIGWVGLAQKAIFIWFW